MQSSAARAPDQSHALLTRQPPQSRSPRWASSPSGATALLLPETVWGRTNARRLFQFLLTNPGQFFARERLMAELWPVQQQARAERDFKVALNALHHALEPDRPARADPHFVARQGSSYGLNPEAAIHLDARQMEMGLSAAAALEKENPAAARLTYTRALALYGGDYLPEALYEDWTSLRREQLSALFLSGATRLAQLLEASGDALGTELWCRRILALDRCWETAYRLLMRAHCAQGNRPQALRVYAQCRQALDEELAVPPLLETQRLYEQIVAAD